MLDILIRGGNIVDGSGMPAFRADVGICHDQIEVIGDLGQAEAAQVIDAHGKTVAPGFIDMHSHGDTVLPFLPGADSKIHQGITLEVVGNCGMSAAPFSPETQADFNRSNPFAVERSADWLTFGEFLERLRTHGTAVNVAALVGHGAIRKKVMQMSDAAPDAQQLAAMQDEVRQAMDAGAIGLSTGLIYTPSIYAKTSEIVALARTAAEYGGLYTSHVRGEGNTLLEALDEAIQVGRVAGIPVEISHLKAAGIHNWYKMPLALEKIEQARAEGLDLSADMYPYNASNTTLSALVPDWVHVGGREAMVQRLQDPTVRARLHADLERGLDTVEIGWDQIIICECGAEPELQGRHLADIAQERKCHPWDALMDILIETQINADIIQFTMKPENVALGLQAPWVSICTDAGGRATSGPFSVGRPHPRNYGSFPRVLGKYVREEKLFSLEEAVRKMTGLPAGKLGLARRGLLKPGYFADVVVFDSQTIADTATYTNPHQYPAGIEWVLVNGTPVIAAALHTGSLPGQIVNRNAR
jgi:N-acyl-D-amino-acid deacylase